LVGEERGAHHKQRMSPQLRKGGKGRFDFLSATRVHEMKLLPKRACRRLRFANPRRGV